METVWLLHVHAVRHEEQCHLDVFLPDGGHEEIDLGARAGLQQKLEGAHDFCPKDVPTMLLMKEMKKRSIDPNTPTAPVDWKGYHDSDV